MPRATPAGPISAAWRNIVGDDAISVDTVSGGSSVTAHTVTVSKASARDRGAPQLRWGAPNVWGGAISGPPISLGGGGRFGERPSAQDARDLLGVERLALEQRARERVQLLDVLLEDLPGARRAFEHDALDLTVDGERRLLAVVLRARDLAAEEDV